MLMLVARTLKFCRIQVMRLAVRKFCSERPETEAVFHFATAKANFISSLLLFN